MSDRSSSADSYGVFRYDQGWRKLLPLEFVGRVFDLVQQAENKIRIVAGGDDLFGREFLLEIKLQYWVH